MKRKDKKKKATRVVVNLSSTLSTMSSTEFNSILVHLLSKVDRLEDKVRTCFRDSYTCLILATPRSASRREVWNVPWIPLMDSVPLPTTRRNTPVTSVRRFVLSRGFWRKPTGRSKTFGGNGSTTAADVEKCGER